MNVLIVMPLGEYGGGAEKMLFTYLANRGRRQSPQLHVLFLSKGQLVDSVRQLEYPVSVIDSGRVRQFGKLVHAQRQIGVLLRQWHIDVVLAWMPKSCIYVAAPAKRLSIPLVIWRHDIPSQLSSIDRILLDYHRPVSAACSSEIARLAFETTYKRTQAVAIHPGVVSPPSNPERVGEIRRQILGNADGFIVGTVARLQPWKRVDLLLKAVAEIPRDKADIRVLVVGGESHGLSSGYSVELQQLGKSLLGDRAVFVGEQRNVGDWLQAMDLFVLPSNGEPFGISLVEALFAGKPVIACAGGGPEEIIDGVTIGRVLKRDPLPEEMATAIEELLSPEMLRSARLINPRRADVFSPQRMALRIDNWIQSIETGS